MITDVVNKVRDTAQESTNFFQGTLRSLARLAALSGVVLVLSACAPDPTPKIDDHWAYKTNLTSLHLNQSHTTQGSLQGKSAGSVFGAAGYVSGQIDGKPTLYIYIRYKDEHGATVDKLFQRDKVSLREDAPDQQGYVEFKRTWERTAAKQEFQDKKTQEQR